MRCAAYLRTSTDDMQDPEESARWQLAASETLVRPHGGEIVARYHDQGYSRNLPWKRRPEATRLLADLAKSPAERGWDVVVIGEPQRAFSGGQFGLTFPLFVHHNTEMWVPEIGGPIDPRSEVHDLIMVLFGSMSTAERNRLRIRVRGAMGAMVANRTGRFLGGRPPYGFIIARTGEPHPNPEKARQGIQLTTLIPDPLTAPVVSLIFQLRAEGLGYRALAQRLTDLGHPWPSLHDPARNHRKDRPAAAGWSRGAIEAILRNPRYKGTDRFGAYRRGERLLDPTDVSAGTVNRMSAQPKEKWILAEGVIPPLVTPEAWEAAQSGHVATTRGPRPDRPGPHGYALRGLLWCDACARKMQGNTVQRVSGPKVHYRCTMTSEYVTAEGHPKSVYVAQDRILPAVDGWLADLFSPNRRDKTVMAILAELDEDQPDRPELREARRTAAEARKLIGRHVAAIEAGLDPALFAVRMKEAQLALAQAEAALAANHDLPRVSPDAVREFLTSGEAWPKLLAAATPEERRQLYTAAGIKLKYGREDSAEVVRATLSVGFFGVGEGT